MRNRISYKAIYSDDDYISHYGVLGMRWGHRKQRPTKGVAKTKHSLTGKPVKFSKEKFSKEDREKFAIGQYTQAIGNAEILAGAALLATGLIPLGVGVIAGGAIGTAMGMVKTHSVKKKYYGNKKNPNGNSKQSPSYSKEEAKQRVKEIKKQNNKANREINKLYKDKKSGKISEKEYSKKCSPYFKIHNDNLAEYRNIYDEYGREIYDW